ncbi:copper-binding protein [Maricaulis parjimensis]|uniref:copper-binding protein n=1 Tax=Maricaulis parjimensis TaxID=144023 RepID=UPI001939E64D|nr:copper-binding protein [Maricaulis parjimensis]
MIDILLALTLVASVQDMHHGHHGMPAGSEMEMAQSTTFGDVRTVDTDARTAFLRHGPMPELGMTGMVMPFAIAEDVDITLFQPGASLTITVTRHGEDLVILAAEPEAE